MKKHLKRTICLLLSLAMVLALAACSGGGTTPGGTSQPADSSSDSSAPAPSTDGEKIIYTNGGPGEFFETPWLNPGTYMYNKTVYAHLIVADADLNPIQDHPDALATYEYSEDGKTLTFTLRDDAYWHDGEKVTPEGTTVEKSNRSVL